MIDTVLFVLLAIFLVISLTLDFWRHKTDKPVVLKSAVLEIGFWAVVAVIFGVIIWLTKGHASGVQYFSGWLLEQSLSIDNLFVIAAIFTSFKIPAKYCHRVLYFGILGAIVLRLLFILLGSALLSIGQFMLIIFGLIILLTAVRMLIDHLKNQGEESEAEVNYSEKLIAKIVKIFIPVHHKIEGHKFFVRVPGPDHDPKKPAKLYATALFLALVTIEFSDIIFAVDSVPAILAISRDVLVVFSSNIFAILGIRSLYFVLEAVKNRFRYVSYAVMAILMFVGAKMILEFFHIDIGNITSLAVILSLLLMGILLSVMIHKKA